MDPSTIGFCHVFVMYHVFISLHHCAALESSLMVDWFGLSTSEWDSDDVRATGLGTMASRSFHAQRIAEPDLDRGYVKNHVKATMICWCV